jgi:hypothetical protein
MPQPAYSEVTLQLVQLGRKAALCNRRPGHPSHLDPVIWIPYSLVEDPSRLDKKGPIGEVTFRIQHWFAIKEQLVKQ